MKGKLKFQQALVEEKQRHYADLVQSCGRRSQDFSVQDLVIGFTENCRKYIEAETNLQLDVNGSTVHYSCATVASNDLATLAALDYAASLRQRRLKTQVVKALRLHGQKKFRRSLHPQRFRKLALGVFGAIKNFIRIRERKATLKARQRDYQLLRVRRTILEKWHKAFLARLNRAELLIVLLTKWENIHQSHFFTKLASLPPPTPTLPSTPRLCLDPDAKTHKYTDDTSSYSFEFGDRKASIISTQVSTNVPPTPRIGTLRSIQIPSSQGSSIMVIDSTPHTPHKQRTFTFSEPHGFSLFHKPIYQKKDSQKNEMLLPEVYLSYSSEISSSETSYESGQTSEKVYQQSSHREPEEHIYQLSKSGIIRPLDDTSFAGRVDFIGSTKASQETSRYIQEQSVRSSKLSKRSEIQRKYFGVKQVTRKNEQKRARIDSDQEMKQKEMIKLLRQVEEHLRSSLAREKEVQKGLRERRLAALAN